MNDCTEDSTCTTCSPLDSCDCCGREIPECHGQWSKWPIETFACHVCRRERCEVCKEASPARRGGRVDLAPLWDADTGKELPRNEEEEANRG